MADSSSAQPVPPPATEDPAPVPPTDAQALQLEDEDEHVEVDRGDTNDNDSAFGDDDAFSSTTSISSSIMNHKYENGRRYHAFRSGTYFAPNDDAENDRLDMHHHLSALVLGGRLITAPIGQNPQRILDVGCGTGIWSIDMGDEYPSAQVLGVDLSPIQPSMVPPNVQFEIDDIEEDWTYRTPFDFIHVRFLACAIKDWPKLVSQCYTHTKPGGWVEFKDWDLDICSFDNSIPQDSYLIQYHTTLKSAIEIINRGWAPGPQLKRWAEEAGYINVTEKKFPVPVGTWAKDERLKEIGAWNYLCLVDGLEGICMRSFTSILGWTVEEVQVILAKCREELKNLKKNHIHAQYNYYVVTGQKPGGEEQE